MGSKQTHVPKSDSARQWLARWVFSPLQGARFGDWMGALADTGFAVDPCYWPRAAFTTLTSLANTVIAHAEERRWHAAIADVQVPPPLFVLGHHRSGTTHLWNLLSLNPTFAYPNVLQAVFPHTFLSFEPIARFGAQRLAMRRRPQDNVRVDPEGPSGEEKALCSASFRSIQMARHFPRQRARYARYLTMREASVAERQDWLQAFDWFARKLLLRQGRDRTLVFRAPDHTAKIAILRELYPDARFVHIHRDPYKVFSSTRWLERTAQPMFAYQRPDRDGLDDFILWRYRAMYDAYFQDIATIPEGCFSEVAFDELLDDPIGTVARIHADLDLDGFTAAEPSLRDYVASLAAYRRNTYTDLEPDMRLRVAEAWDPAFGHWGYAK